MDEKNASKFLVKEKKVLKNFGCLIGAQEWKKNQKKVIFIIFLEIPRNLPNIFVLIQIKPPKKKKRKGLGRRH